MTVYVAIAGVLALMGGIVYYASLDNAQLEQAEIELFSVELRDVDEVKNQAKFDVTFLVKNPSDKAFTVGVIDYHLFTNGIELGSGQYSAMDVALPGRAVFSSGDQIPLKSTFVLTKSETTPEIYEDMINEKINSFSAEGILTTQTSWSTIDKEFSTGF
ncbi:hypothetical protein NKOR_09220 [Candidatus Nitrosopumilus koreensis AR1]|uniref:Late embryogenesis abundant protein LEA-2 subgroup domain-containing protein n=1 Tax=Candidatus Nitrosopumilus koreensis AR1 TaxID=1229908 RepID=K0B669_9ARCH|nr:hypothetical protein NKOR_09220 [Candidatus Nitrosopumilus koreensis AR1]